MLVPEAVEHDFTPCLVDQWMQLSFSHWVFDLHVFELGVDLPFVMKCVVGEPERDLIAHCGLIVFIDDLEQ